MVKDQLLNGFLQSINVQPNMHQDFSVLTDTCRNSKMDLLEHSPNAINSWNPSKAEQIPVKMQISSSPFIPTINAITSSQELQWMVQPAVLASMPGSCLRPHPYESLDRHNVGPLRHSRQGVIRTVGNTHRRSRHHHQLDPDEEEKRRLRRERNKLAAAKCRNRRRELTDQLQEETEELEREQAGLQSQVDKLQEERHKLELMLVSHTSECRLLCDDQPQAPSATPPPMTTLPSEASPHPHSPPRVKQEPAEEMQAYSLQHKHSTDDSPYHHNHHAGEYCPSVDCFSSSRLADCSPGQVMDLSSPMIPHPSLGGQARDGASPREGTLSKHTLSKLHPTNSAMSLDDGGLCPLFSPTLLTL
ncbi:fos-related antigen 2-like [Hypomesus transpacificus]|uniref:fos-related antigen 2-like n=1 Tax=Hypomesus transpacificus TaxID=137520 RepID=UPI001F07CEDC|nr:fos-related antigen 2-like [Hypomesus transpacificus]